MGRKKTELSYTARVQVRFDAEVHHTAANIRQFEKRLTELVTDFIDGESRYFKKNYPGACVMTEGIEVEVEDIEKDENL